MSKTNTESNTYLDAMVASKYLAAFTDLPNPATGSGTEVSGGGYSRVSLASKFAAAASEAISNNAAIPFPTSTGSQGTIKAVAIMSASSGGTMSRVIPLVSTWKPFAAGATADIFTSYGHSYAADTILVLTGRDLPGGFNEYTEYYVINPTTDTFQLSLTQGGAAVDVTTVGGGYCGALSPRAVTAADITLTIDSGNLTIYEA